MIKEIKDIDHLNKTLDQWNSVKNKNHWANLSTSIHADRFDPRNRAKLYKKYVFILY